MFKRIKENEYVNKFLEFWNIPRYRSLIILFIYIIFFAFLISSINTDSVNDYEESDKIDIMEEYRNMNNYHCLMIVKNEKEENLTIDTNENNQLIIFNDDEYYYNNINLYKKDGDVFKKANDTLLEFNVWNFTPMFISNLIEKGTLNSKTEYTDGTFANTYLVKVEDFIKSYYKDETDDTRTFELTVYQNEKQVNKVTLDLTKIYSMNQNANNYDYVVTLEYSLIGEISPIIVKRESSD